MIIMPIKEGENIERALKKFKRKYERTGVLKELRRHRKRRPRILEKQRPPAMFHHPVGYLRHLLHRIHACLYPYQLALPFEQVDIFPQTAVHKQNYFYFYKSNQFSRFGS